MWEEKLKIYDALIAKCPRYTAIHDYFFTAKVLCKKPRVL